jgi:hypothetical protein
MREELGIRVEHSLSMDRLRSEMSELRLLVDEMEELKKTFDAFKQMIVNGISLMQFNKEVQKIVSQQHSLIHDLIGNYSKLSASVGHLSGAPARCKGDRFEFNIRKGGERSGSRGRRGEPVGVSPLEYTPSDHSKRNEVITPCFKGEQISSKLKSILTKQSPNPRQISLCMPSTSDWIPKRFRGKSKAGNKKINRRVESKTGNEFFEGRDKLLSKSVESRDNRGRKAKKLCLNTEVNLSMMKSKIKRITRENLKESLNFNRHHASMWSNELGFNQKTHRRKLGRLHNLSADIHFRSLDSRPNYLYHIN